MCGVPLECHSRKESSVGREVHAKTAWETPNARDLGNGENREGRVGEGWSMCRVCAAESPPGLNAHEGVASSLLATTECV